MSDIKTLDAKWLDPACHQGCQSLVHKQRIKELERQVLALTLAIKVKDEALLYFTGSIGVRDHERNIAKNALSLLGVKKGEG